MIDHRRRGHCREIENIVGDEKIRVVVVHLRNVGGDAGASETVKVGRDAVGVAGLVAHGIRKTGGRAQRGSISEQVGRLADRRRVDLKRAGMIGVAVNVRLRLRDADAGAVEVRGHLAQQRHADLVEVLRWRGRWDKKNPGEGENEGAANKWLHWLQ